MISRVIRKSANRRGEFNRLLAVLFCLAISNLALAEKYDLTESYIAGQVLDSQLTVSLKGEEYFTPDKEKDRKPHAANASFRFSERWLPPAGRDAMAFRALREFRSASMSTTVDALETTVELPQTVKLIVSEGQREGIRHYSPQVNLDGDSRELLEMPGDPLVLAALLPLKEVELNEEWKPSDWVLQMLTGIEAVESSDLKCTLTAANQISAKITYEGKIVGQRFGTNTEVDVLGTLIFDLRTSHIARAQAIYKIQAEFGTIYPGLDIQVTSNLVRNVTKEEGLLTAKQLESIALEPDAQLLNLRFTAEPWGVTIEHDRNWHLFQAVLTGSNRVAIFRLVEHGSLVCQCNFSPQLKAAPGQMISMEQFESDVQQSLGTYFKKLVDGETISTPDGRTIYRVVAEGEGEVKGAAGAINIPMTWIYYLVGEGSGRRLSFVFAVETPLVEQLAKRDLEFVKSQRFIAPQN